MGPRSLRLLLGSLCAIAATSAAGAETPGVTAERIVFGQSAALEGPAADLGIEMQRGIRAAFEEVNRAGGIGGRRLDLISYDDRYEPELAIENTVRLVQDDRVFALIGAVGTPTSLATEPIAFDADVPFIAPFTGAEFLRDPGLTNVVNIRASYYQETEAIIDRLVSDLGISRVGVLYQDDSYGRSGLSGVRKALERRGMSLVGAGAYMRNTTAVKSALLALRGQNPQAIVIIGAYRPSAAFTLWARKLGIDSVIVNISFVGSNALAEALGPEGDGIYVTQVVPFPAGDVPSVLQRYRAALAALDADAIPGFVSLEGYIAGRLTAEVVAKAGESITRKGFIETLDRIGDFNIGGFTLHYGTQDNRGSSAVFLTRIEADGTFVPVQTLTP